ncbi:MAG: S41 family peptidase [Bacteroidales bacterium]
MSTRRERLIIFLPLIISVALIVGILVGNWITSMRVRSIVTDEVNKQKFSIRPGLTGGSGFGLANRGNKINAAMQYILNEYVDTVSAESLNETVLPALVESLDPHSVYIPASEFQRFSEPLVGNFSGIGVSFNMTDDTVAIINTIPNGPSEMVGIMPGDRIIMVDDSLVAGVNMPSDDIVKMLKGPKSTLVHVTVYRRGEKAPLQFEITRDDIPIYSVDVAYMVNDETGYVKISQFAQTTYREFIEAVEKLKSKGAKKYIVDLRRNGGGIMEAATMIADQFLDEGELIVYMEGRARPRENDYATSRGMLKEDQVMILIDEASASASEILAGAIQDNDRGLVVGRRSFGKGLVQEEMRFPTAPHSGSPLPVIIPQPAGVSSDRMTMARKNIIPNIMSVSSTGNWSIRTASNLTPPRNLLLREAKWSMAVGESCPMFLSLWTRSALPSITTGSEAWASCTGSPSILPIFTGRPWNPSPHRRRSRITWTNRT